MGNHFLHEHPAGADSWKTPWVHSLRQDLRVAEVNVHQCVYGCTMKPTRFISSAWALLEHLSRGCSRDHGHQTAVGRGHVTAAAEYPARLSKAVLCGIDAQRLREGRCPPQPAVRSLRLGTGLYNLSPDARNKPMKVDCAILQDHVKDEEEELQEYGSFAESVHDELTGEPLAASLVQGAREEECAFMEHWGVWEEVPVSECGRRTGRRPIGTRWVDVNKGDVHNPEVRCRLVAQEVNTYKEDAFFAATPPLEILLKKVGTLSGDAGDVQEIRVLNRVLRWTAWGIAYEADPQHAELLNQALGPSASLRTTPGLKPTSGAPGDQSSLSLSWAEARLYRACAARANYLALDRVDVAFAAKELCLRMSLGVPRLVWHFAWQLEAALHAYVDTDFAGCHVTRRIDVRWHDIPGSARHETLGGHAETRDAIVRRS